MIDICFICGLYGYCERHHIFGGTSNRKNKYGITVPLCPHCHRELHEGANSALYKAKLHEYGQRKIMEDNGWTIDDFRRVFGKNYLED